jgi:thiamine biosynthesis lipoprotein
MMNKQKNFTIVCIIALTATAVISHQRAIAKKTAASNAHKKQQSTQSKKPEKILKQPELFKEIQKKMGTMIILMAYGNHEERIKNAFQNVFKEIDRLQNLFAPEDQTSQLARINEAAGKQPVKVHEEIIAVLTEAQSMSKLTEGAFDITYAGLNNLWNFSIKTTKNVVPSQDSIKQGLENVGYKKLVIDQEDKTVHLQNPGMSIGAGAISKGYAADKALKIFSSAGIKDCLIYIGGDIISSGKKGNVPWVVGIQDPRAPGYFATLELNNVAIVTSGDYEKFFEVDGVRYHHILDPRTGYPPQELRSVTIIAPRAMRADALSTGVFVLGLKKGMSLVESLEGVEAVMVDAKNNIHASKGIQETIHMHRSPSP